MKTCAYCGKPATNLDLCHAGHPVCDDHLGLGHQLEKLPEPKPEPKEPPKRGRP
jgi:hypothetical protein